MKFNQGRALIIGVANYEAVGSLPAAVLNDALDTAETLKSSVYCGYPEANVTVLADGAATLENIRKALADLAALATTDDTVAIFFSGHGTRIGSGATATSALVPYDCKPTDVAGTTLGEVELSAAIAVIKAPRVVLVVDACHAAGAATLKYGPGEHGEEGIDEGFTEKSLQKLARGTGRVVLASSRATETSLAFRHERNSVFTTAMLSGLKGAATTASDGTIRVFDLFNYVSETVRQSVPGRQHPVFKASDLEENFPIALAQGGTKSVSPSVDQRHRDLEQIMPDLFPLGPMDQDIWLRAGGDVSRLRLSGNGRAQWFAALRLISQGGGGFISRESLVDAALDEFPAHRELKGLR
ncbi:caspase family protein [Achromobacter sp. ACRQX]|uniref:caspase family protein n=1 Tax=Achromobacter sp. ACRQX TaxID=2918181 RepID=UPI001EF16C51|nr:caspase family protein [Achromobacter sp. ACRQX]MCG7324652.1 caspase family protein [Achromobacter sp. ACRQX]